MQLEQKMEEMEKIMTELEQRYVVGTALLCVKIIFEMNMLLLDRLCITDYRTRSESANKVTSQTKT